jgi:flavodoxin
MSSKNVLIHYYSGNGNTQRMAKGIAEGIRSSFTNVKVEDVENFDTALLPNYDAIVVGSPAM